MVHRNFIIDGTTKKETEENDGRVSVPQIIRSSIAIEDLHVSCKPSLIKLIRYYFVFFFFYFSFFCFSFFLFFFCWFFVFFVFFFFFFLFFFFFSFLVLCTLLFFELCLSWFVSFSLSYPKYLKIIQSDRHRLVLRYETLY